MRPRGRAGKACSQRSSIVGCRMSNYVGEFGRETCIVVIDVSGQSRRDLLEHPGVTVGIAERGVGGVTLSLRIWAADKALSFGMVEYAAGVLEWLADLYAAAQQ